MSNGAQIRHTFTEVLRESRAESVERLRRRLELAEELITISRGRSRRLLEAISHRALSAMRAVLAASPGRPSPLPRRAVPPDAVRVQTGSAA